MGKVLAVRVLGTCAVALTFTGTAAAGDITCRPAAPARGHVLLLHAGAWWSGSPAQLAPLCEGLARRGWYAVSLDYPLLDYPAAAQYVRRRLAGQPEPAYVWGFSAGATLALDALLAAPERVRAAIAEAPVTDLTAVGNATFWRNLGVDVAFLPYLSPLTRARWARRPSLVLSSPEDPLYWHAVRWAWHAPGAQFLPLQGRHLQDPTSTEKEMSWLTSRRCTNSSTTRAGSSKASSAGKGPCAATRRT